MSEQLFDYQYERWTYNGEKHVRNKTMQLQENACMCVCLCVCVRACVRACVYVCMVAMNVWLYVCMYVCIYICMFVCIYECTWLNDYIICTTKETG